MSDTCVNCLFVDFRAELNVSSAILVGARTTAWEQCN